MLKISVAISGCKIAHATPSAVCLYRTLTSRHTRKNSSSWYSHRCPNSRCQNGRRGCTMVVANSDWLTLLRLLVAIALFRALGKIAQGPILTISYSMAVFCPQQPNLGCGS